MDAKLGFLFFDKKGGKLIASFEERISGSTPRGVVHQPCLGSIFRGILWGVLAKNRLDWGSFLGIGRPVEVN